MEKSKQIIFLIFYALQYVIAYLDIPFDRKNIIDCRLPGGCYDYQAEIRVGTPEQILFFKLNSTKYTYYLVSDDEEDYENLIPYSPLLSKSSISLHQNINVTGEYFYGHYVTDNMIINNINISSLQFPVVSMIADESVYVGSSGPLGLGCYHQNGSIGVPNFLNDIKMKDIISTYDYSFKFTGDQQGVLQIGALPHEIEPEKYSVKDFDVEHVPIDGYPFWGFTINKMKINNEPIILTDNNCFYLEIKLQNGIMKGPNKLNETLYNTFFKKFNSLGYCYLYRKVFEDFYICTREFKKIKKEFKGIEIFSNYFNNSFMLNYDDLFYEYEGQLYFRIKFNAYDPTNRLTVGENFLRKYKCVFNKDKMTLGIYIKVKESKSGESAWIVILYIILLIVSLIAIFYLIRIISKLRRKYAKKRALEFDDDYEYVNK